MGDRIGGRRQNGSGAARARKFGCQARARPRRQGDGAGAAGRIVHAHHVTSLLMGLLLLSVLDTPAATQVRGMILDSADQAVAEARVELWAAGRLLDSGESDAAGQFLLVASPAPDSVVLSVRRIGFETLVLDLPSSDSTVTLRLAARPVELEPITVAARSRICPNREDPRARMLWERARTRYWHPSNDSIWVFGLSEFRRGVGAKDDAFDSEVGRTSAGWTQGAPITAPPWMARSGYAPPVTRSVGERTAFWNYRALDGGTMQDFTGDYFGVVHSISLVHGASDRYVIGFCPRDRLRQLGQIEGVLILNSDTTLAGAQWRFRTPRPDEDAGGEALYYPPDRSLNNVLLVRESWFWRKTSGGNYYFENRNFTGWRSIDRPSL